MDSSGGAQGESGELQVGPADVDERSIVGGMQLGLSFLFGHEQSAMAQEDGLARQAELGDRRGVCPALSGPEDGRTRHAELVDRRGVCPALSGPWNDLARHAELGDSSASQDAGTSEQWQLPRYLMGRSATWQDGLRSGGVVGNTFPGIARHDLRRGSEL